MSSLHYILASIIAHRRGDTARSVKLLNSATKSKDFLATVKSIDNACASLSFVPVKKEVAATKPKSHKLNRISMALASSEESGEEELTSTDDGEDIPVRHRRRMEDVAEEPVDTDDEDSDEDQTEPDDDEAKVAKMRHRHRQAKKNEEEEEVAPEADPVGNTDSDNENLEGDDDAVEVDDEDSSDEATDTLASLRSTPKKKRVKANIAKILACR